VPVDVQSPGAAAPFAAASNSLGSPLGGNAGATSQGPMPGAGADGFKTAMQAIRAKLDQKQFAEAHLELSRLLYNSNQVPPEKKQEVLDLLDQLAGTVIYSREHLLEAPYVVRPGDTIEQIAQSYNIPWQLLANINGIRDPKSLQTGQELKVVRGPFDALVSLDGFEMTLMLAGRYAGRFAIGVGTDYTQLEGSYVVSNQTADPQYHAPDQTTVNAGDPRNPLGEFWIGLGQQPGQASPIGIHGTNDPQNLHRTGGPGSIRLSDRDIRDAFGILSIGSRVVIQR
jgi:LysM repeat protein